jgi:TetR/AcrR family transcriptional regulator
MGVAERKQREKEARLNSIESSARRLFAKKGFSATSMAEIAEAAEISKGTLYLYFKSKEELYYSLLEPILEYHHRLIADLTSDINQMADVTLREFIDYFSESFPKDPEVHQFYMYYRAEEIQPLYTDERFRHLKTLMAKNVQKIEAVIARGIRQGIFRPVNPRVTSNIIWGLIVGVLSFEDNRRHSGGKDYLKSTLDAAVSLLLDGLKV